MATYDFTLDGTRGGFGYVVTENNENDTINVTVTTSISTGGLYFAFGDLYDYVDTVNFVLPEGWDIVESFSFPAGDNTYYLLYVVDESDAQQAIVNLLGQLGTVTNVCFTRGAMVETPEGPKAIEDLREGDLVLTRDRGPQPIRWVGSSKVTGETLAQFPELRPIRIAADALGDNAETLVSPQHRMLMTGWRAEALFGETEVLATAKSLVNDTTITVADVPEVEYFHILFDAHEIIRADGAWSESFHPEALDMGTASEATRDEVLEIFPELESQAATPAARGSITEADVNILMN